MSPRKWIVLTLILLVLATALQIAGLLAPCWIYLKTTDFRVGVGLYFRVGCESSSGNNCTHPAFPASLAFGYNSESTYDEPEWEAMAWLQTISAITALTLCIMMVVYLIGFGVWRKMGALNMVMTMVCVFTWLVSVVGLILFVIFYGDVITKSPDISRESFPWSVFMVFIAAILFIIITILIRLRCRNRNYLQHAIPTSADSKMALNPSTKNQVMKRYFTPSPYREDRREAITNGQAISTTEQSRFSMPGHANNLGQHALEYGHVNGDLRYQPGVREGLKDEGFIETRQLRSGVSALSPSTRRFIYGQGAIASNMDEMVTTEFSKQHHRQAANHLQQQQQQQQPQQRDEVAGKQSSHHQHTREVFDDTQIDHFDTETIFYKGGGGGGGGMTSNNFTFVTGTTTDQGQPHKYGYSLDNNAYTNGGFATENIGRREQLTTFHTKDILPSAPSASPALHSQSRSASNNSYRIGVEHQEGEPFQELATTHMRRPQQSSGRILTGVPLVNGDNFAYNRKFMYRPYTEHSY